MAKARRLAHELEERRALVGLVRVRPAEGVLIPPAQGTWEALASADTGAFPYVDQYVPLRWRVMAPTKKRPPYPRGCDGADKPEHNLVHHCFASERRRHWAQTEDALAGIWQVAFLGKAEPRTARHQVRRPCADGRAGL